MVCRIAQLVRASAERQNVGGSIPPTATNDSFGVLFTKGGFYDM